MIQEIHIIKTVQTVQYKTRASLYTLPNHLFQDKCLVYQSVLLMQCFITFYHEIGKGGKVKGGSHSILEKV